VRIIDVTVPIQPGMPVYPGDPEVSLTLEQSIADGDPANVSRLDFGLHTGTHVDAPVHFIGGAPGAETLSLDVLIGPAVVVEAPGLDDDVALPEGADRIVFKTRNSELWAKEGFSEDFVEVGLPLARRLAEARVRLVGIDYLSVGDEAVHELLLGLGMVVVEGLDLRAVAPGAYRLICAPLKIVGADGAPARVLLEEPAD
jgi:arylformamidase